MTKIAVKLSAHELIIKFDGVTHFRADRHEISAYQSWDEAKGQHTQYVIEFYMKRGPEILLEYSKRKHWIAVLKELDPLKLWADDK